MRQWTLHGYRDAAGGYRWRMIAANGRIIADSGEAYATEGGLARAIRMITRRMLPGTVRVRLFTDEGHE